MAHLSLCVVNAQSRLPSIDKAEDIEERGLWSLEDFSHADPDVRLT